MWKPGDFAIRGMVYVTKDSIIKCNHTGYPRSVYDVCDAKNIYINGKLYTRSETSGSNLIPYFTVVSPFVFGEEYHNVTGKYVSNISGYEPTTHYYLG
jgi:hypothetical protein